MKARHDIELMQHADGELDASDAAFDETLSRDPAARAKVQAISQMGELVRGHLELTADALPERKLAALWREIDKGIERDAKDSAPEGARESAVAVPSIWRRVGRWFEQHRGHLISGVVGAGAVATLALVLRTNGDTASPIAGKTGTPILTPAVYRPAEIESLETPGGTGSVFNLQDEDGTTTVIWVTPEDTVEGI
jgi:anti-sigma factor RsiW